MMIFLRPATIIGTLPNTLTNGTTADATQVMADLNKIVNDVNSNAAEAALVPTLAGANIFAAVQTGVAATQGNNFPIASQVQNSSLVTVASISGTNTITGSITAVPLTAYTTRQIFTFIPSQPNTGATTLDIDSVGAAAIQASGSALTGGEIRRGVPVQVVHDGSAFQMLGAVIPTGTILPFAGSNAPAGYLLCFGQAVSRQTFNGLFAVLGTAWGTGDGSTTFNLPDLRGRALFGRDNMGGTAASRLTSTTVSPDGNTLGATGGAQTVTISTGELPASGLSVPALSNGSLTAPGTTLAGDGGSTTTLARGDSGAAANASIPLNGGATGTGTTGNMGTGGALNKLNPAAVVNYIIKY